MSQSANVPAISPSNKLAVWALILGIAGLVLSLFFVGILLGLVALVLGIIAVTRPGGKGKSIAGIVLGAMPLAMVALAFWAALLIPVVTSRPNMAQRPGTIAEISILKDALYAFEIDNGRYPTTNEGLDALVTNPGMATWTRRYIDEVPFDKWGRPYIYRCPGKVHPGSFDLISMGEDGVEGTADDIDQDTKN